MSILLEGVPRRISGKIGATIGTLVPDHFANGFGYEANSALAVDTASAIDHYHQGLPFTANGRLCVASAAIVRYGAGAAPFTATGRLAVKNTDITHYTSGVAYAADNSVITGVIA